MQLLDQFSLQINSKHSIPKKTDEHSCQNSYRKKKLDLLSRIEKKAKMEAGGRSRCPMCKSEVRNENVRGHLRKCSARTKWLDKPDPYT